MALTVAVPYKPTTSTLGGASSFVTHREMVADVTSTGLAFNTKCVELNPGLFATFPWSSWIANNFETYIFRDLSFDYVPSCSSASAGVVALVVDWDAADTGPGSLVEATSNAASIHGAAWQPHTLHCARQSLSRRGPLFTRMGVESGDIKTYDIGSLYVCMADMGAATFGHVYASYTMELFDPQLNMGGNVAGGAYANDLPTCTAAKLLGSTQTTIGSLVGTGVCHINSTATNSEIVFDKPYEGLLDLWVKGTSLSGPHYATSTVTHSLIENLASTALMDYLFKISAMAGQKLVFYLDSMGSISESAFRAAPARYTDL